MDDVLVKDVVVEDVMVKDVVVEDFMIKDVMVEDIVVGFLAGFCPEYQCTALNTQYMPFVGSDSSNTSLAIQRGQLFGPGQTDPQTYVVTEGLRITVFCSLFKPMLYELLPVKVKCV